MRDVLPDEVALRDWAMTQIVAVYRRHGFVRIETPAVESLRLLNVEACLFERSSGLQRRIAFGVHQGVRKREL